MNVEPAKEKADPKETCLESWHLVRMVSRGFHAGIVVLYLLERTVSGGVSSFASSFEPPSKRSLASSALFSEPTLQLRDFFR